MQQYRLASRGQNIEQYQKAFDALKGDDPAVHIGAIFGLEILAGAAPEWKKPILTAVGASAPIFSHQREKAKSTKITPDAEAALEVISRGDEASDGLRYPLAGGNFRGAHLPRAMLNRASLEHSDLSGSDLYHAHFFEANLAFALLNGANLASADLSHARLLAAHFCMGENLAVPDLQNGGIVRVQLADAKFYSAYLKGAWLVGADLKETIFWDAVLIEAHLQGAEMNEKTSFQSADLSRADLSAISAVGADFSAHLDSHGKPDVKQRTKLMGTNFSESNLSRAKFAVADLSEADLRAADLTDANFEGAITADVKLTDARFCRTKWSDGKLRSEGCNSERKIIPRPLRCPEE